MNTISQLLEMLCHVYATSDYALRKYNYLPKELNQNLKHCSIENENKLTNKNFNTKCHLILLQIYHSIILINVFQHFILNIKSAINAEVYKYLKLM